METPDERRERIDEARRDQAALHREIGHELVNLSIRPSAKKAWEGFNAALAKGADAKEPVLPRCEGDTSYTDYDAFNVPSPGRAKMMCAGCPFIAQCAAFAEAEKPAWGVFGGNVYGRKLAETERREFMRNALKEKEGQDGLS